MTDLSLAVRNLLAQDIELTALLGKSASWDTWIFDEKPVNVRIENTSKCLIVINESDPWTSPNQHNTLKFPTILVDIWADPTRNPDKSVQKFDAKSKIERIQDFVDHHLHLVDPGDASGGPQVWGTPTQISAKTGVVVTGSQRLSGPVYSPIRDTVEAWMGRYTYGVNKP